MKNNKKESTTKISDWIEANPPTEEQKREFEIHYLNFHRELLSKGEISLGEFIERVEEIT